MSAVAVAGSADESLVFHAQLLAPPAAGSARGIGYDYLEEESTTCTKGRRAA